MAMQQITRGYSSMYFMEWHGKLDINQPAHGPIIPWSEVRGDVLDGLRWYVRIDQSGQRRFQLIIAVAWTEKMLAGSHIRLYQTSDVFWCFLMFSDKLWIVAPDHWFGRYKNHHILPYFGGSREVTSAPPCWSGCPMVQGRVPELFLRPRRWYREMGKRMIN